MSNTKDKLITFKHEHPHLYAGLAAFVDLMMMSIYLLSTLGPVILALCTNIYWYLLIWFASIPFAVASTDCVLTYFNN